MKTIDLARTTLEGCVKDAQRERVMITRGGKPVALIVGVGGMDVEQLQLSNSDKFWTLIEQRRKQKTLRRSELEKKITSLGGRARKGSGTRGTQ